MLFGPMKYEKYASKLCKQLMKYQDEFRDRYKIDDYGSWYYEQANETLRLYSEDKEIYFKYIPVGTFSRNTNTWLWAWANIDSVEPRRLATLKVKAFGEKKKYSNLIEAHFGGDEYTGWELTAIAFDIVGAIGTYRVVSDHLEKYFLLTALIDKPAAELDEDDLIECEQHGKLRYAFVCQHLNAQNKTGFEEAFETFPGMDLDEEDDFQAWCSECEKQRIQTNSWTDESMKFANIKLVCEGCYFDIKEFNAR